MPRPQCCKLHFDDEHDQISSSLPWSAELCACRCCTCRVDGAAGLNLELDSLQDVPACRDMARDLALPLQRTTVALMVTSICCLRMALFWDGNAPNLKGFESMWRVLCRQAARLGVLLLCLSRLPFCVRWTADPLHQCGWRCWICKLPAAH